MLGTHKPMRRRRRGNLGLAVSGALVAVVMVVVAGCTRGADNSTGSGQSSNQGPNQSPTDSASTAPTEAAAQAELKPDPRTNRCYRIPFTLAIAPTTERAPVNCSGKRKVTTRTFYVGRIDPLAQGHLLAVDSSLVQARVSRVCPQRLPAYLGGSPDDVRLSMLRAIWFTPSVEQSDLGASWLRCDVVAVARDGELAPLSGRLRGAMKSPWQERYGLCGTAAPDAPGFQRVICSSPHTWKALSVVRLTGGKEAGRNYPGLVKVRGAGDGCEEVARAAAEDALDFRWGYEWPTPEQWAQGRTFGVCWAPADGS